MKYWPTTLTFPRDHDFFVGKGDGIYLHQFCRSDDDRAMHDHRSWNVSIPLSGRYIEVMPGGQKLRHPFRPVFRRATALHRVELLGISKVWSLFISGPKNREWGFQCPRGWVHWKKFVTQIPGGNSSGPGCDSV